MDIGIFHVKAKSGGPLFTHGETRYFNLVMVYDERNAMNFLQHLNKDDILPAFPWVGRSNWHG